MPLHPHDTATTYGALIQTAKELTEDGNSTQDNPEYTRGIVELLSNTFGYGAFVDDGDGAKDQIYADITAPDEVRKMRTMTYTVEFRASDAIMGGTDDLSRPDSHAITCDEFVQITYSEVRTGPDGESIAYFDTHTDTWRLHRADLNYLSWSDIIVTVTDTASRLEHLRAALRAENISYGELIELQGLAAFIEPGDVELLEAAGVPEHDVTTADEHYHATLLRAQEAFWATVAAGFPRAHTGDFPPDAAVAFDRATEDAMRTWVDLNDNRES